MMQFQADLLQTPIVRAQIKETTALGAAFLAGLAVNFWEDQDELCQLAKMGDRFDPVMKPAVAAAHYAGWQRAVEAVRFFSHGAGED